MKISFIIRFYIRKFKNFVKYHNRKVAVFIVNYNMTERADALYEYLKKQNSFPTDIYLIDNGSDLVKPSKYTNVWIKKNIQTTRGWLAGLEAADKKKTRYFAYMFLITSTEFTERSLDPIFSLADVLINNSEVVGVHPALSQDSTTYWEHLKTRTGLGIRRTWFIDNIASMYRADWFDSIGRFDKNLIYAWGIDLETCFLARREKKGLYIDERIEVRKITNIGYSMGRMNMKAKKRTLLADQNMTDILSEKYGKNWEKVMYKDYVEEDWK